MSGSWKTVEFRGIDGLRRLEPDWRRLYKAMPERTAFHSYDAFVTYTRHLMSDSAALRLVTLSDGTTIRAICPLEERSDRTTGLPLEVWGVPLHPHWPLADVIAPEDDARRMLLPLLAEHVRDARGDRALLVLGPLPEESVLWDGLASIEPGRVCIHRSGSPFSFDCRQSYNELMSRLSRHFRKELRRAGRRLSELGDARFESASDQRGCDRLFEDFVKVESSGWKGHRGTGSAIALHPRYLAFYRDLTRDLDADDGYELNALYAGEACVAVEFCMRTGRRYAALKIGYDEAYARVSPGHLLGAHTLERCCSDPRVDRFDQLSEAEWLRIWRPDSTHLRQAHIAIGGLASRTLIAALKFRYGPGRRVARRLRNLR